MRLNSFIMKIYDKSDVFGFNIDGCCPSDAISKFAEGGAKFVKLTIYNNYRLHPIRYGLQMILIISLFVLWIALGRAIPFYVLIVLTVLTQGLIILGYSRLYRMQKNRVAYRLDSNGISLLVAIPGEHYVRSATASWSQVRLACAYSDCIVFKMDKDSSIGSEIFFYTDSVDNVVDSVLYYWRQSLEGVKQRVVTYSEKEEDEITDFIEANFGEIASIGHETISECVHLDLAVIEPTEERDYYTICTIGAGAYFAEVEESQRYDAWLREYNEYIIYLPSDWNVDKSGGAKEKDWWPFRWLKNIARMPAQMGDYFALGHIIEVEDELKEWSEIKAFFFDYPLPDMAEETVFTTSTGRTIGFLQLVPIGKEEVDFYSQQLGYDANAEHFYGVNMEDAADMPESDRELVFKKIIIEKFRDIVKHP